MPEALKGRDCQHLSCEVIRMKIRIKPWSLNNLGKKSVSCLNTLPRLFAPPSAPQGFPLCSPVLSVLQVGSGEVAEEGGLHWRSEPSHGGPRVPRWPWRWQLLPPHVGPGALGADPQPCFTVSLIPSLPGEPPYPSCHGAASSLPDPCICLPIVCSSGTTATKIKAII